MIDIPLCLYVNLCGAGLQSRVTSYFEIIHMNRSLILAPAIDNLLTRSHSILLYASASHSVLSQAVDVFLGIIAPPKSSA